MADKSPSKADQLRTMREANVEAEEARRKRAPNGTFDKKAYQRELMRKRRAAAKAAE